MFLSSLIVWHCPSPPLAFYGIFPSLLRSTGAGSIAIADWVDSYYDWVSYWVDGDSSCKWPWKKLEVTQEGRGLGQAGSESRFGQQLQASDNEASFRQSFYFVTRETVLNCTARSLPRMQELRQQKVLVKKVIDVAAAYRGEGVNDTLFVSHRWETSSAPDTQGTQLAAVQARGLGT